MGMRLIFARAQTVFPTASLEDAASWGYDTCPEGHELLYAPASDGTRVLAAGAFVDMLCKGGGGGDASLDAGGSLNAFWAPIFDSERTGYDFTALRDMAIPSYARGTFYERVAACNYEGAVASGALEKFGITSLSWDLDRDACDACVADLSSCADELHDLGLLRGFEDKAAAEAHIELNPGKTLALAAMEGLGGSDEVKLTLRVNGTSVLDELVDGGRRSGEGFAFGRMFLPRWGSSNPDRGTWRKWFAFANVQAAVERAIIRYLVPAATGVDAPSSLEENITIKGYPYPARDVNIPGLIAGVFLALVLPLAFITNTVVTVKAVVTDKELRIREGMAMMGLYDGVFWTAHFSTEMIVMTITFVLVSAISVYPLSYSNPLIHFIFFELWGIAFVMHCFFLSTFFSKGRVASLACSMFYLFQLAPAISARVSSPNGAASWNSVCILPGAAMYMWGSATAQLESASLGITADTMRNELNTTGPPHSPATILRQVFGSIVMYTFLTFYFDRVLPKTYGTRLPPWFIFLPSYWKSVFKGPRAHTAVKGTTDLLGGTSPKVFTEARNVEPLAHDVRSRVSVRAKGVTKRFGTVLAVDGLDLEFVEGQVSGLLGHNGAGKTTTLNMLTGMLPATEGEGTVAGYDIRTQMGAIRSSLGVCPQFDILWPTVTVLEHLRMYAAFKGVPAKRVDAEARATAARVGLAAQLNYQAGKMSGGQRRKLSLGIAFIGGPKVVLLDEPTTGMDPESRRFCWSMIQSYKADRTIMLTTHFMDEADVLCDRIAIMSQGAVAANGSSVFLKSRFGIGYTLSLSMLRNADSAEADAVVQLVKSHVAGAEVSSRVGTELTMRLPSEATPKFGALLRALEAQSPAGGDSRGAKEVASYGMSCTTLEEVFLRIAEGAARIEDAEGNVVAGAAAPGAEPAATPATARGGADGRSVMGENFGGGSDTATGGALARQQFDALMRKRFINMKRDRLNVCTQIVTPVLCLTAALFMNNITPEDGSVTFSAVEYTRAFAGNKAPLFAAGADASAQAAASVMAHFPLSASDEDDAALPTDAGTRSAASAACFCPSDKQNAGDLYGNFGAGDSGQLICSAVETSLGPSGDYEFRGIAPECANDFATTIDAALIASAGYVDYACNEQDGAYCDAFFFESARVETTADGGATIDADWTLLPNPSALHSVPVGLNSLHNALLGALGSDAHISLINYPLPVPGDPEQLEETEGGLNLATAIFVLIGLSTLSASFGVFLVWERRCNAKHLQVVSGIDQKLFWFAAFAADYLNYLVATVAMLIVCAAVPSRSLDTADGVGAFAVLLLFFGLGALPLSYALHFKFQSEMACLASLIMAFQFFGMGTTIASIVMQAVGESDPSVLDAYDACKWFFRLIPHYCLGRGTYDILQYFVDLRLFETGWMDVRDRINDFLDVELDTKDEVLDLIDVRLEGGGLPSEMEGLLQGWRNTLEDEPVLWTMDRLGWHLIFLLLDGLLFMSAVLLIEYKRTRVGAAIAARLQGGAVEAPPADEDEDVRRERQEIAAGATTLDTALVVDGLSKTYANGVKATRPMHVRMERGQCFGLLGINGAGKTTTFSACAACKSARSAGAGASVLLRARSPRSHTTARALTVPLPLATARTLSVAAPRRDAHWGIHAKLGRCLPAPRGYCRRRTAQDERCE